MVAANRCHAHARLLRFHYDRELFFVREAAPVRSTVPRRITRHRGCQDSFGRPVLSSAANTAAYFRAGTRMKLRSPVNFDLAMIDQISLAAQAGLRDFRRRGVMRERHPVPVQRLHMHRPERLHRLVAFVRRQLEQSTPALSPTLVALGFGKDFSVLCADFGRFGVRDPAQPTCKRCACEAVNPAVAALRQAAGFVLSVECSFDSTTGASSAFIFRPYPNSARQRNKALVASLCARATAETLFPGCSHSSTMASFSSLVKLRRLARPSRAESAAVASVKSRSTTDSLAALLALVLICGRALG